MDADYAYISTEMEGYLGNILVTYDLKDPAHPQEVSRWHMPGQHIAAGETPTWKGYKNRLHHAMRVGAEMLARSAEGRGGGDCAGACRSRWPAYHEKKNTMKKK